jgi:hypothetical protein
VETLSIKVPKCPNFRVGFALLSENIFEEKAPAFLSVWLTAFSCISVSGITPEDPVISRKSGLLYERRLIEKHLAVITSAGCCFEISRLRGGIQTSNADHSLASLDVRG